MLWCVTLIPLLHPQGWLILLSAAGSVGCHGLLAKVPSGNYPQPKMSCVFPDVSPAPLSLRQPQDKGREEDEEGITAPFYDTSGGPPQVQDSCPLSDQLRPLLLLHCGLDHFFPPSLIYVMPIAYLE
jgi:hypothetical protein